MKRIYIHLHMTHDKDPTSPQLPKAAGIAYHCAGKVLLVRRAAPSDHAGEWAFMGGGIEPNEDIYGAACREVREEGGISPRARDTRYLGVFDRFACFWARSEQEMQLKLNHEHSEYGWYAPDALPSPIHPNALRVLRHVGFIKTE